MFNIMKKLITKHFYSTKAEAQDKCDVFFAVGRITKEEYTELCKMIENVYVK